MSKKLVGIFICTLFIATIIIPVTSATNEPSPPVMHPIQGPQTVRVFQLNYWNFMATDPDGDKLTISIKWGDGTDKLVKAISGVNVNVGHIYFKEGIVNISAFAQDDNGETSSTEYYRVTVPRSHVRSDFISFEKILLRFIQFFPNAYPMIKYLLGF